MTTLEKKNIEFIVFIYSNCTDVPNKMSSECVYI